eukprot:m.39277 g.39277  ORF g.39277 m.39277 type:complete len:159 (+) comp12656_c2_seq2:200-676(+)
MQVGKLVASDGATDDQFGRTVTATDGMVVVGSWQDDDKGLSSGSVYVFEKNLAGVYTQTTKLVAEDGEAYDFFGWVVAATDHMIVVGATLDDDNGAESGSVYVFEKNTTGAYVQVGKLLASTRGVDDQFGRDVAITDKMVVVGAPFDNQEAGSVFVFE